MSFGRSWSSDTAMVRSAPRRPPRVRPRGPPCASKGFLPPCVIRPGRSEFHQATSTTFGPNPSGGVEARLPPDCGYPAGWREFTEARGRCPPFTPARLPASIWSGHKPPELPGRVSTGTASIKCVRPDFNHGWRPLPAPLPVSGTRAKPPRSAGNQVPHSGFPVAVDVL